MSFVTACAATFLAVLAVPAADDGAEDFSAVQEFVRSVQTAEGEELDDAIRRVRERLHDRRGREASEAGTALLQYTLGYLSESRALASAGSSNAGPDGAQRDLRLAAASYARFLALEPGHLEGARAVARTFERGGRPGAGAEVLLREAEKAPAAARGALLRLAGGLFVADGAWRRGLETLGAARRAGIDPLDLQHDLQRIYEDVAAAGFDADGLTWLDAWCDKLADGGAPAAALPGWRVVMRAAPGLDAPAIARDALASWTLYAAELEVLDLRAIEALRVSLGGVDLKGVETLRAMFGADAVLPELGSEAWGEDPRSIAAVASAARARARAAERDGKLLLAQDILWRANDLAAYSEDANPMLGVLLDLALLYGRHPEIDADGRGFGSVEGILFMEKNQAYRRGDAATIERTHRIFAQIYIERGAVEGGGLTAAPYHVDRAREAARGRVGRGRDFEPYPELSELLAIGLEKVERADGGAARRNEALARRQDAAAGFLEVDDVQRAGNVLREGAELHGASLASNDTLRSKQAILSQLVDLREETEPAQWSGVQEFEFAMEAIPAGLDASFVTRQYLRGVSDRGRIEAVPVEVKIHANQLFDNSDLVLTGRDLQHFAAGGDTANGTGKIIQVGTIEEPEVPIDAKLRPARLEWKE